MDLRIGVARRAEQRGERVRILDFPSRPRPAGFGHHSRLLAATLRIGPRAGRIGAADRRRNLRVVLAGEYFKWLGAPRH